MGRRLDELAETRLAELAGAGRLRRLRPYRCEGAHLVTAEGVDSWPELDKGEVAERLLARAAEWLAENTAVA